MRRVALGLATLALLIASPVLATQKSTVSVRVVHEEAPVAGEAFRGELEIRTPDNAGVTNVALDGPSWSRPLVSVRDASTAKSSVQRIEFTSLPTMANSPLTLSFDWNGERHQREIQLFRTEPERLVPGRGPVDRTIETTNPPPPTQPEVADEPRHKMARNIRVRGNVSFERPDGVKVGADNAQFAVMEDDIIDGVLATGTTDSNGNFDITFFWNPCPVICGPNPDIYVLVKSANTRVSVDKNLIQVYEFATDTIFNYGGSDLNLSDLEPTSEDGNAALGILTNMIRTWRFLLFNTGIDLSNIGAMFPDDSRGVSYYSPAFQTISITSDRAWTERTHIHEYGHHFINLHGNADPPDYCNGICDTSATVCGHCFFCEENTEVAWSEGWPTWLAHSVMSTNDPAPFSDSLAEEILTCASVLADPFLTEGFFTAVLTDISDSENEDDDQSVGFADVMSLGFDEILTITTEDLPKTPAEFFADFRARYPQHDAAFWETARNNIYQLDNTNPPQIPWLVSTSHSQGVPSEDTTVDIEWTEVTDDFSGVGKYVVDIARQVSPGIFDSYYSTDLLPRSSFTCPPLEPGRYKISVAAMDRAGNIEDTNFLTLLHPIDIVAPSPANLTFEDAAGWYEPVMPQANANATSGSVPLPNVLNGDDNSTWWNLRAINDGSFPLSSSSSAGLLLDGARINGVLVSALSGGQSQSRLNRGPINVRGGRHTLGVQLDEFDLAPESDEFDNELAYQWVWNPLQLFGNRFSRAAPPDRYGGHGAVPGATWQNCDGFLHFTVTPWSAVYIIPSDTSSDYDLRQHTNSPGVLNGFKDSVSWSARGAGLLDAVFINVNGAGVTNPMAVGVVNANDDNQGYEVVNAYSGQATFDLPATVNFAADEYLKILHVDIASGNTGPVGVEIDAGVSGVHLGWLDVGLGPADMHSFTAESVSTTAGTARVDVQATTAGTYAFVVWREPGSSNKAAPLTVTATVSASPPDLVVQQLSGWHSPLVPRNAQDGTLLSTPLQSDLIGPDTYLNFSFRNDGLTNASGVMIQTYRDGVGLLLSSWGLAIPQVNLAQNSGTALNIPGGRHTLSYLLDSFGTVTEAYEDNNVYAEQYVWQPVTLSNSVSVRTSAPDRNGGRVDIVPGEPNWYNAAGYRTPVPNPSGESGWWGAIGVLPVSGADVDVRLHERSTGSKNGFESYITASSWGPGLTDFVLINHRDLELRAFDAGMIRANDDPNGQFRIEMPSSTWLGTDPWGTGPNYLLGAEDVLRLFEMELSPATYEFYLDSVSGSVNWGFSLYSADQDFLAKDDNVPGAIGWLGGANIDESFTVDVPTAGRYCLAVWKVGSADELRSGWFNLTITPDLTDTPLAPPSHTQVSSIYPSPFNPRTTVTFELARSGPVKLEVYSLRGERVRTLVSGAREAGRHAEIWDGTDDTGRPVATGVYLARLIADGGTHARKMVLLK